MSVRSTNIMRLLACAPLVSCGSGPFEPIDPVEVTIELGISGGFAGQSFSFRVLGETGEVVGLTCESFCDFVPGELLVTISAAQTQDLADRLEAADVFELSEDYGTQCCDQIEYDLRYVRGDRSTRVQGSSELLPTELRRAIEHLAVLGRRTVPTLVALTSEPSDWPQDSYSIDEVGVEGAELQVQVSYSGGCEAHPMDLIAWGGWLESFPVQLNVMISHDDRDDPCDAVVTSERAFDLTPIARAYADAYGPANGGTATVVLRLSDPSNVNPEGYRLEFVF